MDDWILCEKPSYSTKLKDLVVAMLWLGAKKYWYWPFFMVPGSWQISFISHMVGYLVYLLCILQRWR